MKAVIFDMDGLLIDSETVTYQIDKELVNKYSDFDFQKDDYARNYSGKTGAANMRRLIDTYKLPFSLEEGLKKVERREKRFWKDGIELKPGAKELLRLLKDRGFKIALATSSVEERAEVILNRHKIYHYFDQFVFAGEVDRGKPEPDIFLKACAKLGEAKEDCLVLEDSEAGVQAAYRAHVPVICVPDMKMPGEEYLKMTETCVSSLQEVCRMFLD